MTEWINAAEAARQLGVKQATLYSYVSRGVLTRRRGTGGKISLFDAAEVGELARRGRPRRPPGLTGLVIESGLTEIADDTLRFRGIDALDLAQDRAVRGGVRAAVDRVADRGRRGQRRGGPPRRRSGRASAAQAALPPARCRWSGSRSSCPRWPRPIRCGCTSTRPR